MSDTSAFRLVDRSAEAGFALWAMVFDLPGEKVNKFNTTVMGEFETTLGRLERMHQEGNIEALILFSGKPKHFIAGADINLIQSAKSAQEAEVLASRGQALLNRWEDLPFPRVVAIDGVCLGGGCELSLASSAIVMSNDPAAKIGLPEVMLGLVPGMGGCVRMPQKVGVATAFDLILTGKTLSGEKAYRAGLADACLPKEGFEDSAVAWVKRQMPALKSGRRIAPEPKLGGMGGAPGKAMESTPLTRAVIFKKARDGVMSKTKGHYPAPLEAIQVVHDAGTHYQAHLRGTARDKALAIEARAFGKMAATEASKNLIRLFFLTEAVKKYSGVEGRSFDLPKVVSGGVLGAGVMGGGIAQLFADKGIVCRMKDINVAGLALGAQAASKLFAKQVSRKRITKRQMIQKMNLIAPVLTYDGFQSAQVIVEAVIEKMDVKKSVIAELEKHASPEAVIASNTSSLSITEMQKALRNPERFVGMHFFNPVHRMPLVEVIRGAQSSDEAVAQVYAFSKQLGKTPIVVKDASGFLVNRLLGPYMNEAMYLLAEGNRIEDIDEALLTFGMPMGPIELLDEVGIDVGEKVGHILHDAFGERMTPAPLSGKLTSQGRLGKKTLKGMYAYEKGGYDKSVDAEIYDILGVKAGASRASYEEIVDRCVLVMVNEAARCLDEKIVSDAETVDLGMIMGTGFPPFRGGLLRYADSLGAREIVTRLKRLAEKVDEKRFAVSPTLSRLAEGNQGFHQAFPPVTAGAKA